VLQEYLGTARNHRGADHVRKTWSWSLGTLTPVCQTRPSIDGSWDRPSWST